MSNTRKVKIMEVTPEVAGRWLEKNTHNRSLRQNRAEEFAEAMRQGAWKLSTEAIAFSRPWMDSAGNKHDETLINGQHRLWAVIFANKPVMFTVWWGCEPDEFGVIDQGITRTQGDVLQTTRPDLCHPTKLISVIGPVVRVPFTLKDRLATWHTEIMLRAFPRELDLLVQSRMRVGKVCTAPVTAGLFLSLLIDEAKTGALVERLHTAVGFTERDPVRTLHLYLNNQREPGARETVEMVCYKTLHACLAQIDGKPLTRLLGHIDYLADARRRAKSKIDAVVRELHGGKLPEFFYHPRANTANKRSPRTLPGLPAAPAAPSVAA